MDCDEPKRNGQSTTTRARAVDNESPPIGQPPTKRQRVLACRRCRSRKQKCEDTRPCMNCQKSNAECLPTDPAPRLHVESEYVRALEERIAELESLDPQQSQDHIPGTENPNSRRRSSCRIHSQSNEHDIQRNLSSGVAAQQNDEPTNPLTTSNPSAPVEPYASPKPFATTGLQNFPDETQLESDDDTDIDHFIFGLAASPVASRELRLPTTSASPASSMLHNSSEKTLFMPHALIASIPRDVEDLLLNVYRERAQIQYPFLHWDTFMTWFASWKACTPAQYASRSWQGFFVNLVYATALLLRPFPRIGKSDAQTFYTNGLSLLSFVFRKPDPILHVQAQLLISMYALHRSSTQRILCLASTTIRYCVQHQFHLVEIEKEPITPAIRLENQVRRRCFWCAYKLDRLIVASFDLPPSLTDAMITAKIYANIEDHDLLDVANRTPADKELPDSRQYTSLSPSLHILQCRRIQSEIAGYTLRWDYASQYEKAHDWRVRILAELENYKLRAQRFSEPQSKGYTSQRWLAMIYHYTLLTLFRPKKDNVAGAAGDWSVQASSQACLIFRKTQMDRQIASPWIGLLVQFQSGVTLLYCFWATPPEQRTENYDAPDVSDALRACSNILAIMADRWPKAECLRDTPCALLRTFSSCNS
ncbi:hypothetical protein, variant [Verruconis gallopava]|uniref:Zn(2)-C6 fungal-type domain-containing protein n=1 Tax=Verruconis gallopava TaxID=253628 RepID=A0A0D2AL82_9PEZI|nr:hypothetical protein, variant [Verruconis gallopava]KIV99833.1 hypothetical protein, variant [Verruconis gallopava]